MENNVVKHLDENDIMKLKSFIDNFEIKTIDDNNVVLSSKKNVIIVSEQNIINIAKDNIIHKSRVLHLNPFIGVKKLWEKIKLNNFKEIENEK